jgi:hypothetical protein
MPALGQKRRLGSRHNGAEHPLRPDTGRKIEKPVTAAMCHVWTAPGWQGKSHVASLVDAAMCSAFKRGSHDRWP